MKSHDITGKRPWVCALKGDLAGGDLVQFSLDHPAALHLAPHHYNLLQVEDDCGLQISQLHDFFFVATNRDEE